MNKKFIMTILVIFVILFVLFAPEKIEQKIYKKEYTEYVTKYSKEYNVDENLVYAVIKAESNFNPNAKSNKNAIGLMQLVKSTALEISKKLNITLGDSEIEEKLKEPEFNINLGTKYLSILLQKYGNTEIAVCAYNSGIGTTDNWIEKGILNKDGSNIENIPYKETNNYVRKILRNYKIYSKY